MLLRSRFLSRQIDVESMTKPAEKADHSPKYRFAECWTLDPAVYRLADEHRAAQIQPPTDAYHTWALRCTLCTHKNNAQITLIVTNERGWRSVAGCCCIVLRLCTTSVCTSCTAPSVGLLLKSSCSAHCVGPSFFVRMI